MEQSNKVSFCDTEDCILSNCDADSDTTQDCCCDECMNGVVSCSKEDYLEFNDCLNSKVSSGHIFSSVNCPNKNKSGSEDTYAKRSISQCRLKNIYKTNESKECFCEESANEDTLKLISVNFTLPKQTQKNTKCCDCSGMQDVKNPNLNS